MTTDFWRAQVEHVILGTGDMIVDSITGYYGVLVARVRKEVSCETESSVYFWRVKWSYNQNDYRDAPNPDWMEESGLKMSILVGFYDLHQQI